jgi:hypothetical protein
MSFSPPLLLPLTGKVTVDVKRSEGGSRVKGVWVNNAPTTISIEANIQPVLKGTDTLLVPEGDRSKEIIKIYTTTLLKSRVEGTTSNQGDVVEWDGKHFEVMKVIEYQMGVLNHVKAIAVRRELT